MADRKKVKLFNVFTVELPGNAGTGYSWEMLVSPGLRVVNEEQKRTNNLLGGENVTVYTIQAIKKGPQEVHAIYRRLWTPITGTEKKFHLNVDVM
jgi:predicted secreted protein